MSSLKKGGKCTKSQTRAQRGFEKMVDLAVQFSNLFLMDLKRLGSLVV